MRKHLGHFWGYIGSGMPVFSGGPRGGGGRRGGGWFFLPLINTFKIGDAHFLGRKIAGGPDLPHMATHAETNNSQLRNFQELAAVI